MYSSMASSHVTQVQIGLQVLLLHGLPVPPIRVHDSGRVKETVKELKVKENMYMVIIKVKLI